MESYTSKGESRSSFSSHPLQSRSHQLTPNTAHAPDVNPMPNSLTAQHGTTCTPTASEQAHSGRRWFFWESTQRLTQTFYQDWTAIAWTTRRRWLQTLLLGWLLVAAALGLMIVGMHYIMAQGYFSELHEEMALLCIVNHVPVNFARAVWIGAAGDPIVIIPVFLIGTVIAIRAGHPIHGLTVAAAYLLVSLLVILGWTIWDRPRPTVILDGIAAPDLHSFPSGHMAQSTAVYGILWYFWLHKIRRKSEYLFATLLLVTWIALIAISRLVLGAHWVTDILAGTLIGLGWLAVLIHALRPVVNTAKT